MWESVLSISKVFGKGVGGFSRSLFQTPSLCAVHVRKFEGASPLSNLMEVKD